MLMRMQHYIPLCNRQTTIMTLLHVLVLNLVFLFHMNIFRNFEIDSRRTAFYQIGLPAVQICLFT